MSKVVNKSFEDILDYLRTISDSEAEKGRRFELLIKRYLEIAPPYADIFESVWTWSEFPLNGGKRDTGIDLVAKERVTGNYCAIQCKFYAESYTVQKKDIDSFFNEAGKELYSNGIIVTTTDNWTDNASSALDKRDKDIQRIRFQNLKDSAVDWSSFIVDQTDSMKLKKQHTLLPHQSEAYENVLEGFQQADRGKLIMACGTGKTFTSLKIAEAIAKQKEEKNSTILYLVPSISLLSQTLTEWNNQSTTQFRTYAVCSDRKVSRNSEDITSYDIGFPATTDSNKIVADYKLFSDKNNMTVVFSTYQSIEVLHEAQKKGFPTFDLIISDEAHRTTGVTLSDGEESHFVRVHDNEYIQAEKRLYQTATPKVFGDKTKNKADEKEAVLSSMDDVSLFGETFYDLKFGEAVERGLLTDYKVMVLVTDQNYVDVALANEIKSESNTLRSSDFARIVGTWNGLSKRKSHSNKIEGNPMKRAVAYTSTIETSKQVTQIFQDVVDTYTQNSDISNGATVEIQHVDGTMNTLERNNRLDWLKDEPEDDNVCRILSNARCLTEGVDVPDLDSVIFFNPRNSVIDVIQSVGRVMRKADDKEYGYIILPVTINKGNDIETELNNNKEYKVVWQVLQALRSHDERFNAMINQMELNMNKPSNVEVIGHTGDKGESGEGDGDKDKDDTVERHEQIIATFPDLEELQDAIYGQIVDKVGDKRYWENWSNDVAEIAQRHFDRIKLLLRDKNSEPYAVFQKFLNDLRSNLNNSIETDEAIEMLSQHLITKPVFDALFEGYSFVKNNPVSIAMENMLSVLEEEHLEKETRILDKFYESVKTRASKIDNLAGKQKVIIELYDKFFGTAFKRTTERLGIVYTPVEIVDFIINSVNETLKDEFDATLNDKGVHILEPFVGTGTFIVQLLQSGLINKENLLYKFTNEIHANEIVLLAYYIASINIEETFHELNGGEYQAFEGMVLADTFQLTETKDTLLTEMFGENSERAKKQNEKPIVAIMGNPPYSAKQRSENDNNQNEKFPKLDRSIKETYAKNSTAQNKNNLYDSYIRAIRWATDRIEDKGVIGFVTNGSFIDSITSDGLRQSLYEDFTSIYIFNLRGNARTSGEERKKESGNVFGMGTRTPVAIMLLVKNSDKSGCKIYYKDIGDYLSREAKLSEIQNAESFGNMKDELTITQPDKYNNWIGQRNEKFDSFIPLSDDSSSVFKDRGIGFGSSRDAWVTNYSTDNLVKNVKKLIYNYNHEIEYVSDEKKLNSNKTEINWSDDLKNRWKKSQKIKYNESSLTKVQYRPFAKRHLYNDKPLIKRPSMWNKVINKDICDNLILNFMGGNKEFSTIVTNEITDYQTLFNNKSVPLYFIEYDSLYNEYEVVDNVNDSMLSKFRKTYSNSVTKEDIFYYVYGILHSNEYRKTYANDLRKEIPRIPLVKDFWGYSKAGFKLVQLHINYEDVKPYPIKETKKENAFDNPYEVKKMRFGKNGKEVNKSVIHFNDHITVSDIPLEAYNYQVNGRSPIEWVIDQYEVKKDKNSGIKNDPNEYADNPRYVLDLLKRVITVSIETNKIVNNLPDFEILE